MVKIGREIPVASMESSGKIIWAKHNEIQTVNIKTVGADFEVRQLQYALKKDMKLLHVLKVMEFILFTGDRW